MLDPVRAKDVAATPEEGVRQELVQWLHAEKQVPLHLMETECALSKFHRAATGRVDILVHGFRTGSKADRPWLLAECKRPGESDWQRLQVQVNRYLQWLKPQFLLLQIGNLRYIYQIHLLADGRVNAAICDDLPLFKE